VNEDRFFAHEFEVWQGDEMCASASGPESQALADAMHYASQYRQDGPVRVFRVVRTLVASMPARGHAAGTGQINQDQE
jgi:hypothetical protein